MEENALTPKLSIGKKARIALAVGLVTLGTVETTGAVINEQNNNQPISAHSVAQDLLWPYNLGRLAVGDVGKIIHGEVPTTFDNTKEKQAIGDNNIKRITIEEAKQQDLLTPKVDDQNKTLTIPFSFALAPGTTAIIDKTPYNVRGIEQSDERNEIPANTPIIVLEGTRIQLIKGVAEQGQDPNLAYSLSFAWYDQEQNRTIAWGFYPDSNIGFKSSLKLIQQPIKGTTDPSSEYDNLPVSDGKTPVASTTQAVLLHASDGMIFNGKGLSDPNPQKFKINYQQQDGKLLLLAPSNQ